MKPTYEITLPDGSTRTRRSPRTYTHAVVTLGDHGWDLVAFCESLELAEKRIAEGHCRVPAGAAQIVPVRVITPLTDRQRAFLLEIGDKTVEMFGTSHLVPLIRRGLVERRFIGQRYWRVRRTEAGRRAVTPTS